jgi:Protein of unknown function (DUF2939)
MKRFLCLAGAVAVLVAAYIAYPYWTLQRVESAILNRDAPALEALVDWQQLRTGIKSDFRRLMTETMTRQTPSSSMEAAGAALGVAIGGNLVDSLIDGLVSANGILGSWEQKAGAAPAPRRPRDFVASARFQSLTTFRVDMRDPDNQQALTLTVLLELTGAEWRATKVVLPLSAIQAAITQTGQTKGDREPAAKKEETESIPDSTWRISEDKSPIDDSPQIRAMLSPVGKHGLFELENIALMLRCKEKKTEVVFATTGIFLGSRDEVKVLLRINDGKPIETSWSPSTSGDGAFAPSPVQFIRALPDDGKLFIRAYGYRKNVDAEFHLGAASEIRAKIAQACRWDAAANTAPPEAPSAAK